MKLKTKGKHSKNLLKIPNCSMWSKDQIWSVILYDPGGAFYKNLKAGVVVVMTVYVMENGLEWRLFVFLP